MGTNQPRDKIFVKYQGLQIKHISISKMVDGNLPRAGENKVKRKKQRQPSSLKNAPAWNCRRAGMGRDCGPFIDSH